MNIFSRLFKPQTVQPEAEVAKTSKTCTRCKKTLGADGFNKCQRAADGLQYWCKTCQKITYRRAAKPVIKAKKRSGPVSIPSSNFEKPFLQLNIPDVSQAQYRQLVELAKAKKWPMERLYRQMVTDFLTLHTK